MDLRNRLDIKKELIEKSKQILSYGQISTNNAYYLASQIIKYFEKESLDVLSELKGSVTESTIKDKITIGCVL